MRIVLLILATGLLALAWMQIGREPEFPNYALSLPGQSELTFWASHKGLTEIDFEGQVGYGEMARLLARRRSNAPALRPLRDRFFFLNGDLRQLRAGGLLRAVLEEQGIRFTARPGALVLTAGRTTNLPLIVESAAPVGAAVKLTVSGGVEASGFTAASIAPKGAAGYLVRLRSSRIGAATAIVTLAAGGYERSITLPVDVRPKATLRVEMEDETGQPAPARIFLTAADGLAYTPAGAVHRIAAMPAESFFYADGSFTLELPAGPTKVEAVRGLEYALARQDVVLAPGANPPVKLRLSRWIGMARRGWHSADSHIHANYVANHHQVITPEDIRLQTQAEDLNIANLMVANSYTDYIHDEGLFEGRPHRLSTPRHILYWNEEMRGGTHFGHMCFFNLKTLVKPYYTGPAIGAQWEDYPANATQARKALAQGGAVTYAHPGYLAPLDQFGARELPIDLALGAVDAMDVLSNSFETAGEAIYHRLLNCGFRLTASAGTDSFTNITDHYIPGGGRVYVQSDKPFDYGAWIEGYKAGRTFVTNGPMVFLTVDGKGPGAEVQLGEKKAVAVRAQVISQVPIDTLELLVNGKPVAVVKANGARRLELARSIPLQHSAWIAARVRGPWSRLIVNDAGAYAHTTPVYVRVGDERIAVREDVEFFVQWIERLTERVRQKGRFATPEHKEEVLKIFNEALEIYRAIPTTPPPSRTRGQAPESGLRKSADRQS